jgi:hypothetical protein
MMETALIVQILNMIQAGIGWVINRGISRDRIQALLDAAEAEGRDVSQDDVQAELDALSSELDETEDLINDED